MIPKTKKDILFVGLQFLLFIGFVLDIELFELPKLLPDFISGILIAICISIFIISLLQLNKNLSPFPSPKINSQLVKNGIYKYIRHPIYTALFFGMLVWSLYQQSFYQLLISILILILFYFKSKYEEKLLCKKFEEYKHYMKNSGRFLPKLFLKSI